MKSWTTARTEPVKSTELVEGDHIVDPDGRRMLSIFAIERFGDSIYLHGTLKRRVLRKVYAWQMVDRCIPMEHVR